MANLRDLRRRIKSVKNTSQITRAMQMVSATKMRRAQTQALASRPYTTTLAYVLSQILSGDMELTHPLLLENNSNKIGVLIISTDKGLCGALNTNLFRFVQTQLPVISSEARDLSSKTPRDDNIVYFTLGRKGRDFVVRTGKSLDGDFENKEAVKFSDAIRLRKFLVESFVSGNIGRAYILYSNFISTLRQEPKLVKLLPININDVILSVTKDLLRMQDSSDELRDSSAKPQNDNNVNFLFEPDLNSLFDYTLTHYLDTQIYQALLEAKASEHSARMIAMQNATNNAKDLVDDMTLTYNGLRQENITKELLEIVSAGAAQG